MTNEEFIKNVSLEGEEWRDVVGFEGLYMVSSFGRVISLKREYPDIDHIDGNSLNNNVHNLRWCNQVMNMNNPITRKRLSSSKTGKLNTKKSIPVVRISDDGMIETFPSVMEAYRNGYNHSSILKCCKHKMHTHKRCKWMFLSDYENLTSKSKNDIFQTSD